MECLSNSKLLSALLFFMEIVISHQKASEQNALPPTAKPERPDQSQLVRDVRSRSAQRFSSPSGVAARIGDAAPLIGDPARIIIGDPALIGDGESFGDATRIGDALIIGEAARIGDAARSGGTARSGEAARSGDGGRLAAGWTQSRSAA